MTDLAKAKREITDLYAWVQEQIAAYPIVANKRDTERWGKV